MSNNPYQSSSFPESIAPLPQIPASTPWQLTVFAILFCIFGGLGILALPQALIGILVQGMVQVPGATEQDAEVLGRIQQMTQSVMIPTLMIATYDSLLGMGFLFSGIQLLRRKLSGAIWGKRLVLASIPAIIFRSCLQGYVMQQQFSMFDAMADSDQGGMAVAMKVGQVFGIIVMVVILLISIVYNGLAYWVVTRPENLAFLRASENQSTGLE